MSKQVCKTCAGTHFLTAQGKQVCQLCGSPYSDTGDLLIDTKAAMPILCERGYQKLQAGEYSLAELIFNHMLEIDSNNFMSEFGKALALSYMYTMSKSQEEKAALWDFWRKVRARFSDTIPEERTLVKKYCEPLRFDSMFPEKGCNLLLYGILFEMPDLVQFLLDCGFDPNYEVVTSTDSRFSALFLAAITKKYTIARGEIIGILLRYGASPYILTNDGCGVINSKTLPEVAQVIRQQYPDVKCIDGRSEKPTKASLPTGAKASIYGRKANAPASRPVLSQKSERKKGCSCLLAIVIFIFALCAGGIINCVNSNPPTTTASSSKEHEYVKCRSYEKCGNYVWMTKWNRGYCSDCHKGTHKCAYEGCEVQIPDYSYQAYCMYHE